MGFWAHNSGSRHARRSIKVSTDADDSLVSRKILKQKSLIGLAPRASQILSKFKNTPICDFPPREPRTQIKTFCLVETERLAESVEGLNSFLTIAAGEL